MTTLPVHTTLNGCHIIENEINFLAFPRVQDGMVIFGARYGFETLGRAHWLRRCRFHYWGDIDAHGFAILDALRARFDHVESFLTDRGTFMAFESLWGTEDRRVHRDLPRLTAEERALYDPGMHTLAPLSGIDIKPTVEMHVRSCWTMNFARTSRGRWRIATCVSMSSRIQTESSNRNQHVHVEQRPRQSPVSSRSRSMSVLVTTPPRFGNGRKPNSGSGSGSVPIPDIKPAPDPGTNSTTTAPILQQQRRSTGYPTYPPPLTGAHPPCHPPCRP